MEFKKYEKIHRLGAEENVGILIGKCYIQEKIDGANTSIWFDGTDLRMASRNREVTDGFNGFCKYVRAHEGINKLLKDKPNYRLYGEWLVKHTINYKETSYKQFYLFDIEDDGVLLNPEMVVDLAKQYDINHAELFAILEDPTLEQIEQYAGRSILGDKGEGVVVKNPKYVNKFGRKVYAKVVTQEFKESNSITFGGNNKHSETYWEMFIVNKCMTLPRLKKTMNNLQPVIEEKLGMKHTGRVIQTAYHDMFTEEMWGMAKKVPRVEFKTLSRLATRKAAQIYHDILHDSISVADETSNIT